MSRPRASWIRRCFVFAVPIAWLTIVAGGVHAQTVAPVSESVARRVGLTRAWFAQVAVNHSSDHLDAIVLNGDLVLMQTSGGMVHALDAETGGTAWTRQIGVQGRTALQPGANAQYVACVNGSTLFVLNRSTGDIEWSRKLKGSPGAGPVLTESHVFVPLVNGILEGYDLEKRREQSPWIYQSFGRIFHQPVSGPTAVGWTTDKGNLYIAMSKPMTIHGRLKTRGAIESRPAYWTPYFYTCSLDGSVYASHAKSLQVDWRFPTGEPIHEPPIAINDQVFVIPRFSGMYCLNAMTGGEFWLSPGIAQFVARGATRVYAMDNIRQLAVLDAKTGARVGTMPLDSNLIKLRNDRNDRLYFFTTTGLVECLREIDQPKPIAYAPPALDWTEGALAKAKQKKKPDADADAEKPAADAADGAMKEDEKEDEMKADGDAMDDEKADAAKKADNNPFGN